MSKNRLAIYLAVTFGLSWGLWIPAGLLTGAFARGIESSPVMQGLVALGMFFPLAGALLTNMVAGESGRVDLRLRPRLREAQSCYLLAWLSPAAFTLLGTSLYFLVFPRQFDMSAGPLRQMLEQAGQSPDQAPMVVTGQVLFAVTLAPLINMIPAMGEEAGWRGMLYPLFCDRLSPRRAVLVSGVIWGLWHAPVTAMGHNYGRSYPGFPVVGILAMIVFCTSMGCLLSWLYERAESVWPCALAHGAVNAIHNMGVIFCTVGQTPLGPSPAGLVAGLPLLLLAAWCWLRLPEKVDVEV